MSCFSVTQDKCIESSVNFSDLNIGAGDDLDNVIKLLGEAIVSNKNAIASIEIPVVKDEVVSVVTGTVNSCTATINNVVELTVTPSSGSVSIYYTLEKLINSLSSNYNLLNASITVKSKNNTIIYSGTEISAGFNIDPSKFPIVVNVLARVNTPCGVVEYSKSFNLESTSSSGGTFNLNADSVAKETLTSQNDVNKYFNSRLDQLESTTNNKTNTVILGCNGADSYRGSTDSLLQTAYNLICQLQIENESLTNQISALETSVNESLASYQASINSLQNQINTLK